MKRLQYLITILTFFLCFHTVSALEIESYKITAAPIDGNYVENVIEFTIVNDKETVITEGTITVAVDAEINSISDSYGPVSYTTQKEDETQKLSFTFEIPVEPEAKRVITLQTKTYNIVQKEGYFEYILVIVPSKDIVSFTHILRLEKDVILYSTKDKSYIIAPKANVTETDGNIFIEWRQRVQKEVPAIFLVRFSQETGINYWKWFWIIVIIGSMGVGIGIVGNKLSEKYKQNKALRATNILNEREKAVLNIIIKNPEVRQYEIVKQLGYTKSNMSKIVKRLELRGLVEVKKEGKIRILKMGEKIRKEL